MTSPLDTLHHLRVIARSGMLDVRHPVGLLRGALAMRRLGPLAGAVRISALRSPTDTAIVDERGATTYGELDRRTNALARSFSDLGAGGHAAVGVLCRDHVGAVEAMVAAGKAGDRLVLLNTGFAKPQLADVCAREGVTVLVADEEFAELLSAVPGAAPVLAWSEGAHGPPTLDDLIRGVDDTPPPAPRHQGGLVLLTGGTTGTPKGAPRKVTSPLAAAQFLDRLPLRRGDVVCIAAPTFHGTGLSQLLMTLALGSTAVIRRRFDPLATVEDVARHRGTVLVLVPTMLQRILALGPDVLDRHDTSSLRIVVSAGAPLPAELGNRATERFGPVVHNFYGCTEVALATIATPEDWAAAPGTVGRPPRTVEIRLLDDHDDVITASGASGRIFVRNSLSFQGYSGGGGKTVVDGFMSTGDTGHFDGDGRLFVDGRDDDMIVSGGENVFPQEIENLVKEMPGVEDAASVPVPDDDFGQRLRMYVVPEGTVPVTAEDVTAHVRAHLARFKVPREVVFLDAIPYTAAGKVSRRELAVLGERAGG